MTNWTHLFLIFLASLLSVRDIECAGIKSLIQNNVAGAPVNFMEISWPIDPEAGIRRRTEYVTVNGWLGNKHVERIGLGEDGRTEERRLQQRIRDEMGALSYQPPL